MESDPVSREHPWLVGGVTADLVRDGRWSVLVVPPTAHAIPLTPREMTARRRA